MKKKRFLALMLVFTLLAATFTMGGCGTGNTTSQTIAKAAMTDSLYLTMQWNYSMQSCFL